MNNQEFIACLIKDIRRTIGTEIELCEPHYPYELLNDGVGLSLSFRFCTRENQKGVVVPVNLWEAALAPSTRKRCVVHGSEKRLKDGSWSDSPSLIAKVVVEEANALLRG